MPKKQAVRLKQQELHWPTLGVVRRFGMEGRPDTRAPYPTPWSVNVRIEDQIHKRLRGGSRPGLTKYIADDLGVSVDHMISIPSKDGATVSNYITIVAEGYLGVINSESLDTTVDYLQLEDGEIVQTEAGESIELSTSDVPADCFLVPRNGKAYGITTTYIYEIDPVTLDTRTLTASGGAIPTNCTFGTFYRDRLALSGENNIIYFSRVGDPEDWDYGVSVGDTLRSTYMQLSGASGVGEAVTALMAFGDSNLIAATQRGLWAIQGDPATGSQRNISRGVGVIGSRAWCSVEDARVGDMSMRFAFIFLSETGLFMVGPNGDGLQSLSEDRLPEDLQNIAATTSVSLVYSPEDRGIYIFLTPTTGDATHWFFDMVHNSFWPISLQTDHQPLAACWHDGKIILACKDGYVRYVGGDDDDGTSIDSYILLGPIRMSTPFNYGMLMTIRSVVATSSGDVTWNIITGDTAEEAYSNGKSAIEEYQSGNTATADSYVANSGAWEDGRSRTAYPRVRGMWMCVLLKSDSKWAYESIIIESRDAGRWR